MAQLPNLIIIGSPKYGTTSLYYYLGLLPESFMSREKAELLIAEDLASRARLVQARFETSPPVSVGGEAGPAILHRAVLQGVPQRCIPWSRCPTSFDRERSDEAAPVALFSPA